MKINEFNKIENADYIVLYPKKLDDDFKESVEYSLENIFYIDYEPTQEDTDAFIDFINNNVKKVIFFDYDDFYRKVLPHIRRKIDIKWVYSYSLAMMTAGQPRAILATIMEFYDRNIVNEIGCMNYQTYEVLKHAQYNVSYIKLDIDPEKNKCEDNDSNSIGIIGNDNNPNFNTYDELSALKLVEFDKVKMICIMPATKHFVEFFDINHEFCIDFEDVIKNNFVNLYCNFTYNNIQLILKSIDYGIPVILGNTDIFDKYPKLKELLVLKSDDDINEIAQKINNIKPNKEIIIKEFKKFREDYSKESKETLEKFLK